ncbi:MULTISPECIES: hypothetical protein [Chryseobacterium]|uniref:hypothetical protein n=1 Tax=Chryseobacterium TaxID=59732 RepID=UPI0028083639|nr:MULTISPECIES: hypothetical protein [Chryseobacterium]MDQ8142166.1 hypothetical protein [Chryseobacterium sp. CFS15]
MKKSLFVAAIAAISLVACKKGEATTGTNDSIENNADSIQSGLDSTADAQKDSINTTTDMKKDSVEAKSDSAKVKK